MSLSVRESSTWRDVRSVHVKQSGTWRRVYGAFTRASGTWRSPWRLNSLVTFGTVFGYLYGYNRIGAGSLTDGVYDSALNIFDTLHYNSSSGETLFKIDSVTEVYTKTSYGTTLTVDGVGSTTFAAASSFTTTGAGGYAQWLWAGDVFGLAGRSGESRQISVDK